MEKTTVSLIFVLVFLSFLVGHVVYLGLTDIHKVTEDILFTSMLVTVIITLALSLSKKED